MAVTCGASGSSGQEIVDAINENENQIINTNNSIKDRVPKTGFQNTEDWNGESYDDSAFWVGTNPSAKIYPDGSVLGVTDNGTYTRHSNGSLEIIMRYFPCPLGQQWVFPCPLFLGASRYANATDDGTGGPVFIKSSAFDENHLVFHMWNPSGDSETGNRNLRAIVISRWKA